MTTSEELDDKFSAHFHRDPLPEGAGIRIILLTKLSKVEAEGIIAPLSEKVAELGRAVEKRVVAVDELGVAEAHARSRQCLPAAGAGHDRGRAALCRPPGSAAESHQRERPRHRPAPPGFP